MTNQRVFAAAVGIAASLCCGIAGASSASAAGLLKPVGSPNELAVQDHDVRVLVEDGYATTTIEQRFANPSVRDLEAIYVFPVPQHAAVAEFTYWIDGKPVTAEVMKREEARTLYENEKSADRETALAEQESYKRFQMSVWPVRGLGDVRIRLTYVQSVKLEGGVGRYVYPLEEGGVDDPAEQSFWTLTDNINGRFSFELAIRTAYPVEALRVPGNPQAVISQDATGGWQVSFADGLSDADDPAETQVSQHALNQDVVVYWRQPTKLQGSLDIIANKTDPNGRGTFMAVLTPGDDLPPVTSGRDWTFVVDRSGSMAGKFSTLINGLERALGSLPAHDRFRMIVFNNQAQAISRDYRPATPNEVSEVMVKLAQLGPSGGTNFYAGLEMGLANVDAGRPNGIIVVTDGVANVGRTDRKDFVDLAARADVRLFTVIMGSSANRPLLEHLVDVSGGQAVSVSNSDDITGRIMTATASLSHHALTDLSLTIDGVKTADLTPTVPAALHRGQQLVMFGHYWGDGPAQFRLTGQVNGMDRTYTASVPMPNTAQTNPEIERLWAFSTIEHLMRQRAMIGADQDTQDAITSTAIEYGLLTPFTSMVVVRDDVFANLGIDRNNAKRVEEEQVARQTRQQSAPQAATTQIAGAPRAHVSNNPGGGGGGSGAAGPLLIGLMAFLRGILRRKPKYTQAGSE